MKLGTRFVLLTLSLVLVPLLSVTVLATTRAIRDGVTPRTLARYTNTRRWLDRTFELAPESTPVEILESAPENLLMAVIRDDGEVLASIIPGLEPGTASSLRGISESGIPGVADVEMILIPIEREGETWFLLGQFQRTPASELPMALVPLIGFPGMVIVPATIFSLWILRALRRSVLTLHDAAVRITHGDLAFEMGEPDSTEFADVHRAFDQMRRTIRDEYDRRARFTMGVSHDLKTPLALIKGYAEAIEDGYASDPETLDRYVKIIRERSDLLQERISHLIEFLKLETGEWHSTLREVGLISFVQEVADSLAADVRLMGGSLETRIDLPREVTVRLDPVLVRRAVENLAQNAVRYAPEGAEISLEVSEAEDGSLSLSVSNPVAEGVLALDPERLAIMSEPLARGDQARSTPGYGLGLAIVKSVVESHGWSISAAASTSETSRVTILLPPPESAVSPEIHS